MTQFIQPAQPGNDIVEMSEEEERQLMLSLGMCPEEVAFIFALEHGETQGDVVMLTESPSDELPASKQQPTSEQEAA